MKIMEDKESEGDPENMMPLFVILTIVPDRSIRGTNPR